jgi:hypothetical protein
MMNQPLRRLDPLGRSGTPTTNMPIGVEPLELDHGSAWPISAGSVRAIVDSFDSSSRRGIKFGAIRPSTSAARLRKCRPGKPSAQSLRTM